MQEANAGRVDHEQTNKKMCTRRKAAIPVLFERDSHARYVLLAGHVGTHMHMHANLNLSIHRNDEANFNGKRLDLHTGKVVLKFHLGDSREFPSNASCHDIPRANNT